MKIGEIITAADFYNFDRIIFKLPDSRFSQEIIIDNKKVSNMSVLNFYKIELHDFEQIKVSIDNSVDHLSDDPLYILTIYCDRLTLHNIRKYAIDYNPIKLSDSIVGAKIGFADILNRMIECAGNKFDVQYFDPIIDFSTAIDIPSLNFHITCPIGYDTTEKLPYQPIFKRDRNEIIKDLNKYVDSIGYFCIARMYDEFDREEFRASFNMGMYKPHNFLEREKENGNPET